MPDTNAPRAARRGMPEATRGTAPAALRGERLERLLADLAAAPGARAAAQCLTDAFVAAVAARRVLLYVLEEGSGALTLLAASPSDGRASAAAPARMTRDEREARPLFAVAMSLFSLSGSGDAASSPLGSGRWLAVPLPQPQLSWSTAPISAEAALREAGSAWRVVVPSHGERRGRIGHAPLGVAAIELDGDVDAHAAVDALLSAATLAGPILSRGLAVEQYRETAERLDAQRDLLSALIDSLPDPVLLADPRDEPSDDARMLVRNRRASRLFDAVPGDGEERRAVVDRNRELLRARLSESGSPDSGAPRELALTDPDDGSELLFELSGHMLQGEPGRDDARLLVLRDVTALRRAHAQLERQVRRARHAEREATRERDRLDRILDYVADPIVVTDLAGNVVESNRQAQRLLRVGREEASDDAEGARHREANLATFTEFIRGMDGGAETRRARLTLVQPATGMPLPVEVVAGTVTDEAGGDEAPVVVSVLHDLTTHVENERLYEELKRFSAVLEARVRAATADLAEQNAQLQWQSEELERANRLKSEFLASMSHELRTPINALIGYTALLRDHVYGDLTPKQEDGLRRIQTSAEHLLALINDILDLARIEAGRMPVHLERTALQPLLRSAAAQGEAHARAKGLEFAFELPDEPLYLHTDPDLLRQVLSNLLSNAVKFTPQGRVVVRAAREGDRVRIDVADTGIGIRTEDLDQIWEDFRQLDQSRTREYGGTGLGLSIVRKLAERLGAEVTVSSEPDVGSTFTVRVPAADASHGDS